MDRYFLFSVLKQMRRPIITIIIYYTISILGLILIPGIDNNGLEYKMGFFHALYVVVFTSTTIGFGEIPFQWTDNQRLWILIISISGVVSWVYAMGKIISLSQNKIFKDKIDLYRFENNVKKIKKPFYIIIGFGITGTNIMKYLNNHDFNVVIIDKDEKAFSGFDSNNYKFNIPYIVADASNIKTLKMAGIQSPNCNGLIIVSGSEKTNIEIAISSKLLDPEKIIIVRAEGQENINNLLSFGADHIVSSSQIYANNIELLLNRQEEYNLRKKLNSEIKDFKYTGKIPDGKWIVCGYNETTKRVVNILLEKKIDFTLISEEIPRNKALLSYHMQGVGVSKNELNEAGITKSSVIFVSNQDDFDNLSTIITAKELNSSIYTISIQNKNQSSEIFKNADIDLNLQPQYTIAEKIHSLISEPYLNLFFNEISKNNTNITMKLEYSLIENNIETWHFRINKEKSFFHLLKDNNIYLKDIIPYEHEIKTLMLKREDGSIILDPKENLKIKENDVFLFAGNNESFCRHQLLMYNKNIYEEYEYRKNKKGFKDGKYWNFKRTRK